MNSYEDSLLLRSLALAILMQLSDETNITKTITITLPKEEAKRLVNILAMQ